MDSMQRLLDSGLEELTVLVYKMGGVAEKALSTSIDGFIDGKDVSKNVHELSEILVNRTVEVEEKAFSLIAKYQPVASDLRIINSYMKVSYDFERYGRYAWDISFITTRFSGKKLDKWIFEYIGKMAEKVLDMVRISINSLKSLDPELLKTMTKAENAVDKAYFEYLDKLVEQARITNESTISSVLVVRYLERIADHAMHIMEAIVYIATGEKVTLR
ncbi:MAG TPA: phosphate signaling complex protein PhoU [Candidatus Limnocylindrales bacterium]|nr:phosphate signaling complex protein PhoU [Candidatus Limnocylindrales bacterium]